MKGVVALGYHGVSDRWPSPMAVSSQQLRHQVAHLLDRGYRPVTVSQAAACDTDEPLLVVTFDDALASVHRVALPILESLGVVATVYAPSEPILTGRPMAWPEVRRHLDTAYAGELDGMTVAELHDVLERGWEVGSHTCSHPWLPRVSAPVLADELERSREELRAALGIACTSLAYPFGAHDDRVVAAARRAGYTTAVTLPRRLTPWPRTDAPSDARLRLSRIGVYRADDAARFRLKLAPPVRALRQTRLWDALAAVRPAAR